MDERVYTKGNLRYKIKKLCVTVPFLLCFICSRGQFPSIDPFQ